MVRGSWALVLACVVSAVLASSAIAAGSPTWLPQQALSSSSAASQTRVVMDNNGDALAVWVAGGDVEYSYRPAGGASSWSTASVIDGAGSAAGDLEVSMNQYGVAVAVWDDSETGDVYASSFSTATASFAYATTVAGGSDTPASAPDVAVDNSGNAWVVWIYDDDTESVAQAAFWPGSGGSFGDTQSLTTDTEPYSTAATDPQVVVDSAGNAIAAWQQWDGTHTLVESDIAPAGGGFGGPGTTYFTTLSATDLDASGLELASDVYDTSEANAGGVTAVWQDSDGGVDADYEPLGYASNAPWNGFQRIDSGTDPAVTVDGLGNATAVYVTGSNTIDTAYLSAGGEDAGNWSSGSLISTSGDTTTAPEIASNSAGESIAVWLDSTAGEIEAAVAGSPGATFGAPVAISSSGNSPSAPWVALDSGGDGIAGWQQGATAQAQVAGYDNGPRFPNLQVPSTPYVGHAVTFSANVTDVWSTLSTSNYAWTFGDGDNATGNPVPHTYSSTGEETPTLTVTDAAGVQGSPPPQDLAVNVGTQPAAVPGGLFLLDAPNDCFTGASWGCGTVMTSDPTSDTYQPAISPDGKNVYLASLNNSVTWLSRTPTTGALIYMGCYSASGAGGGCTQIPNSGLSNPAGVVVSPDGANVYVVGQGDDAIVSFTRNTSTGALTWQGCIGESDSETTCQNTSGVGLDEPWGVAVSPDGKNVYVSSQGNGGELAEFDRDPSTGMLTQSEAHGGCISGPGDSGCGVTTATGMANTIGLAISPDGDNVYVETGGTFAAGDIAEFSRNASTDSFTELGCIGSPSGGCSSNTTGTDIDGTEDMTLSPDGKFGYINSFNNGSIVELSRNTSTGALSQIGCVTSSSSGCATNNVAGLVTPLGVAISPDGANLYASGAAINSVVAFVRNPSTGLLTQLASPFNCLSMYPGICGQGGAGLVGARRLVVSPDGQNVYVAGQGSGSVVELSRSPGDADLALSVSGAPATIAPGGSFAYTYTITDNGPASVTDPVVRIALSSLLTGTSAVPSQGSCSGGTCSLGPMDGGSSATIQVPVTAASVGTATTAASVSSELTDPNEANNSVQSTTTIKTPTATTTATSTALPAPVIHKTADAYPVAGKVYVKLPGSKKFIALSEAKQLPIGTVVDARHGTIELVFAKPGGGTMEGQYWGGEFTFTQAKNGNVTITLYGGDFAACKKTKKHAPIAVAASGRSRSLWSNVHGRFTTKGRAASGSVRGTEWLTRDTCAGTTITVTRDKVLVTNLKTHKTHLVHAPHSIFIKI